MTELGRYYKRINRQYGKHLRAAAKRDFTAAEFMVEKINLYAKGA